MLKINSAKPHAQPVYAEDIAGRMRILGIPRVPLKRIQEIIDAGEGKAEKLVPWPEGASLSGGVEVSVSDDMMQAEIMLYPPRIGGDDLSEEDVAQALRLEGIRFGIQDEAISEAIRKKLYRQGFPVAFGVPAQNGCARNIRYFFLVERGKPWLEMPFGRINLKELNYVQNVSAGEVLAEYLPAVPPQDGTSIFGERIPAEQAPEENLPAPGENTKTDGNRIIALVTGNVLLDRGFIRVEPLLTIKDVNYETGNIEFNGTVEIKSSIADGFSVRATGDILIRQCVGRVALEADRNIILAGGINGGGTGTCMAGGDIIARYVEGAVIRAEGSLIVEELIMQASVSSNGNIILKGKRAELIGGSAIAAGSLWCKKTGAANGTETRIILGVYPKAMEEYQKFQRRMVELEDSCLEKEKMLKILLGRQVPKESDGEKISQAIDQLRKEVGDQTGESEQCARQMKRLSRYFSRNPGVIAVVENVINPGTLFRMGTHELRVSQMPVFRTWLICENETIIQKGYNPASAPQLPEVPVFDAEEQSR
ncbi:MAG: DUF342 domain-containing protein [Spirochaetales bacterium]|nr:DUF342 domain-containing protein [Spirochaetales bacterium]